jgi:hypothetical protein
VVSVGKLSSNFKLQDTPLPHSLHGALQQLATHPVWLQGPWRLHLEAVEVQLKQRLTTGQGLLLLLLLLLLVGSWSKISAAAERGREFAKPRVLPQQRPTGRVCQLCNLWGADCSAQLRPWVAPNSNCQPYGFEGFVVSWFLAQPLQVSRSWRLSPEPNRIAFER